MLFLNENLMAFWSIPMKETMKKNPTSLNMLCWAWSKSRLQEQKNPIRTKFIQWSARDGALVIEKKELLFPIIPPVNVK